MASQNKKNKGKNSFLVNAGLKFGYSHRVKRLTFYNSKTRQELKQQLRKEREDVNDTGNGR